MSLYIDGVVNIRLAMIKNITPVFSKHTAKSDYNSASRSLLAKLNSDLSPENKKKLEAELAKTQFNGDYPIYAEINLQIESLIPADSNMLWEGALAPQRDKSMQFKSNSNTALNTDANPTNSQPVSQSPQNTPPQGKQV
jgi:hypothetical protein